MSLVHSTSRLVALTTVLCLTGCGLQYNGAWGMASDDSQPNQQQQADNGQRMFAPKAAAEQDLAKQGTPEVAPTPAAQLAEATSETYAPFGLFGQIHTAGDPGAVLPGEADNLGQVTSTSEGADFDPDVDPTGQWLAYASTRHRKTADVYIQRVGGATVTQLTNDPSNDVMPAFSADGKRIAFASDRSGNWDIYVMDIAGGQSIQITNGPTHDIHPSFSPDGKQLIYCSFGAQSRQWELVLIDVDNPATRRILGPGLFPNWSPVGNRIVFQRARQRGTRWFSIWTVDVVNGEATRPTEIAASANAATITPQWSPDGRSIVFCTVVNPDGQTQKTPVQADIWVVGADGRGRANLTHSPFANLQPVWSPDGRVFFVSNRGKDAVENIWAVRPDKAMMLARGADDQPRTAVAPAPGNPGGVAPRTNGDRLPAPAGVNPLDDRSAVVPTTP